jgi:glutamate racemase
MAASIGVYDSGYGGLSVLRHIRAALPEHDLVYFGDSGRAPYGGRDVYTVLDFAEQSVELLFAEGCRTVVVACHTVSCVALRHLQQRYCGPDSDRRVLGVTIPGAELAVQRSAGHIGVLATERTVRSGTWKTEIGKLGSHQVTQVAAALLAPLVEEGWEDTDIAERALQRYLAPLAACDTVMLGCTHYPWLMPAIRRVTDQLVLDPAPFVAERLVDWLARHPDFDPGPDAGLLRVLCSGDPARFAKAGARFLGAPLGEVDWVGIVDSRLVRGRHGSAPVGQITR